MSVNKKGRLPPWGILGLRDAYLLTDILAALKKLRYHRASTCMSRSWVATSLSRPQVDPARETFTPSIYRPANESCAATAAVKQQQQSPSFQSGIRISPISKETIFPRKFDPAEMQGAVLNLNQNLHWDRTKSNRTVFMTEFMTEFTIIVSNPSCHFVGESLCTKSPRY